MDGRTEQYHVESDCAYTFVTVPWQDRNGKISDLTSPAFIFKVTNEVQLMIPLLNHTSFFYNANFMTHRQTYNPSSHKERDVFYNISS